ncbi:hypothetical protein GWK08_03365 [Leptobacterium flavescens]|uniref:Uncharacterized protein n=1 Tax=Leptobacterium flavescens TaxID=472055 RepID=A0A6P0UHI9_9FLAO|nr:hypothetical protein [Leptobacterium flavescens]NER12467.1 hypothetical protein [Leptobacterium flavescens]
MRNKRSTLSFVLLGAFLIMLFHNVVPHIHHLHSSSEVVSAETEHHHHCDDDHYHSNQDHHHSDLDHHHSDHQETGDTEQNTFLSFFSSHHSHTAHVHEQNVIVSNTVKRADKKIDTKTVIRDIGFSLAEIKIDFPDSGFDDQQQLYKKLHLNLNPLRGPPSLG